MDGRTAITTLRAYSRETNYLYSSDIGRFTDFAVFFSFSSICLEALEIYHLGRPWLRKHL
jgi:hypothetical protein